MACHEIAGLRLGLMRIIGIEDEAEKQHELAELGESVHAPGPIAALVSGGDLLSLKKNYEAALAELETVLARTPENHPKLGYLRTLLVLTRKVELELGHHLEQITHFYRDLDEMHDLVHEIYPGR